MRQVLCPVLVGREEELRVLLEALDGAVAGRGTTVVVTGEAGAGKSRLVRELSGKAMGRGLPVLTGRAAGGAVPVPFRPLAEAVLGELRRGGLPDLPELRPFRPALGRLVPEWQPRDPWAAPDRWSCSARASCGCCAPWPATAAACWSWRTCTGPDQRRDRRPPAPVTAHRREARGQPPGQDRRPAADAAG